jgi:hypothetical protein
MADLTEFHILPLLTHLLPTESAKPVAEWVKQKDFRVAGLDTFGHDGIRNMTGPDRDALGEAVYDAYCRARGVGRVHAPENLCRAIDLVAEKFHFASGSAMRERSERLYINVVGRLETFAWRDHYLVRQTLDDKDLAFAVNTWFKTWREKWSEEQAAYFNERQAEHIQHTTRTYTPEELFEAVQEFMAANPGQEYTYNQVADGLRIANTRQALVQRMKVKDALERLSNPLQNIYEDVVRYATRPNKKGAKSATVYKWAPQRRKLDREKTPTMRRVILKGVILEFVRSHPDCSQMQIKEGVRAALAQIDNAAVTVALAELVRGGEIAPPHCGAHRTYHYRASENLVHPTVEGCRDDAPQTFDPNDIFGVDAEREAKPNAAAKRPWEFDEETMMRMAARRPAQRTAA